MSFGKIVHFIGIGGIGVSALARYFLAQGYRVRGSDLKATEITEDLERVGALISIGHDKKNVRLGTELVIYSPAIQKNNPELKAARATKIKTQSYPEALGELTKKYFTIAVSGSHGKSTTTALIALILIEAGFDPTVIVGTKLKEFGNTNFRKGNSNNLVIEADEWNRSFYHYFPKVITITNIDKEHLDTYKNFSGVIAGFRRYLENLGLDGTLVANFKDPAIKRLALEIKKTKAAQVVFYNQKRFKRHELLIPGKHNQINAEAALATAKALNIEEALARKAMRRYRGAWRRLERLNVKSQMSKVKSIIYNDYAHHPTEIRATLQALREKYPRKRLVCVFEPHQEERLKFLFSDFISAFDRADKVVILPVYQVAGREKKAKKILKDSFDLAQAVKRQKKYTFYAQDFFGAIKAIKDDLKLKSVIVFMGAGGLDSQVRKFLL